MSTTSPFKSFVEPPSPPPAILEYTCSALNGENTLRYLSFVTKPMKLVYIGTKAKFSFPNSTLDIDTNEKIISC